MEKFAFTLSQEKKEMFDQCIYLIQQRDQRKQELVWDPKVDLNKEIDSINKRIKDILSKLSSDEYPLFINRLRLCC